MCIGEFFDGPPGHCLLQVEQANVEVFGDRTINSGFASSVLSFSFTYSLFCTTSCMCL